MVPIVIPLRKFPHMEGGQVLPSCGLLPHLDGFGQIANAEKIASLHEYTRDAGRANLAQISGRDSVASYHSSSSAHRRNFISPMDSFFRRAAQSWGEAGGSFRFLATSSCVRVAENRLSAPIPFPRAQRRTPANRLLRHADPQNPESWAEHPARRTQEYHQC